MKIRTGFVSNSSSSSYIVDIYGIAEHEFIKMFVSEYCSWKFEYDDIKNEVYNNYTKTKIMASQGKFHGLIGNWVTDATENKNKFDKIKTDEDFARFLIEYKNISISTLENDVGIRLSGWVSMHNSFEDMPELLKEILLFFLIDTEYKVECIRIDES